MLSSFVPGRRANGIFPHPLHDVPFQHRLLGQDPSEVESTQVQSFKTSVQDQLGHGPAHGGRVLQAVAAEARGKEHVVDQRVETDDAVLVEGVVVVEAGPGAGHLREQEHRGREYQKPASWF